jgi:WD repeat-containing protein 23
MGTCSVHSWNDGLDEDEGVPSMGMKFKARLEPDEDPDEPPRASRTQWWRSARARTLNTQ